ncbi:MAG: hypothetical protein H0T45_01080, partial [Pyrinomonadaceae bacterium]|nr:hypothetical protein [Pyrinomonadaceae bacterium]
MPAVVTSITGASPPPATLYKKTSERRDRDERAEGRFEGGFAVATTELNAIEEIPVFD